MRAAIFDIGSNSVKVLIAETVKDGKIRVIEETSIATRLAEDLIATGELKEDAMARTLTALGDLAARARELSASAFRAVATSAVRDSKNRKKFLKAAAAVLGFPVRLLSGEEEAEAIFAGVQADPHWGGRELMVVDVGGGSAEWVQGLKGKIEHRLSLPLGCVRLRQRFLPEHPVGVAGVEKLCDLLHGQLQPALAFYRLEERLLVATGGTATCLAAMELELSDFDPAKIDHHTLTRHQVHRRLLELSRLTLAELGEIPGLPPKRTDLIIPGTAVLYVTMEILGAHRLTASIRGLRYGELHRLSEPPGQSIQARRPLSNVMRQAAARGAKAARERNPLPPAA